MPSFCAVFGCGNRGNRDEKSFFRLPSVPKNGSVDKKTLISERRAKWLAALKRSDLTESKLKYLRICEDHFFEGKPSDLKDVNHPDWIPSKNLGYKTASRVPNEAVSRFERIKRRKQLQIPSTSTPESVIADLPCETDQFEPNQDEPRNVSSNTCDASSQTDLIGQDLDRLNAVYQDVQTELIGLKSKINAYEINKESFQEDEKCKYYTGIPDFTTLLILFDVVSPYISETGNSCLDKFQKFILCMMHMRLNLDFTDLGYRFGISKFTASRVFSEVLNIMDVRLSKIVFWPEREELIKKVPQVFLEAFGRKVTVIIDCFEIKIEKPGNPLASAQCYSHYKHCHTIKYLIGISPQGAIVFISKAWGGRTSDKHIVQNCKFLEKLCPGDLVLADRGFTVQDEVQLYCAELKLPAFTKGKKQLDPLQIEDTRHLARVRIHVERVIGQLRQKYRILDNIMPLSLVRKLNKKKSTVDQILNVCCALVNFMPSVIPFD